MKTPKNPPREASGAFRNESREKNRAGNPAYINIRRARVKIKTLARIYMKRFFLSTEGGPAGNFAPVRADHPALELPKAEKGSARKTRRPGPFQARPAVPGRSLTSFRPFPVLKR
jgi:hypothetical protein